MTEESKEADDLDALYKRSREVETSNQLDGVQSKDGETGDALDLPGFRFLTSLLKATPFTDFLHYKAVSCYTHKTKQGRITKYCEDHPKVAKFCTVADLTLRLVAVVMVLSTIGAILVGTIIRTFYA